jgi:hypothetical protein
MQGRLMKKLPLTLTLGSLALVLTGCGIATTTYTPAYTSTTYFVDTPNYVQTVGYYPDPYFERSYWNTGYYYPYQTTNVFYGGNRVYRGGWRH